MTEDRPRTAESETTVPRPAACPAGPVVFAKREIAIRSVIARLRRRLEGEGLRLWKATKREVDRFGLEAGDHIVTSAEGIVDHGSLERLARARGALDGFEVIAAPPRSRRGRARPRRRRREGPSADEAGQGRLPF